MTAAPPQGGFDLRRFLLSGSGWPYLLVPFIPVAIALELAHASASLVFSASALGVIPTAALMGRATEELAARSGPGIGGLLNVTFGNAPELIIALFALGQGLQEVVRASLVGSVIGNALLVLGAAMVAGARRRDLRFNREHAMTQSLTLLAVVSVLVAPSIVRAIAGGGLPGIGEREHHFSSGLEGTGLIVSLVLVVVYSVGLGRSVRRRTGPFSA